MGALERLTKALDEFNATPEAILVELQMQLAKIVLANLKESRMTQSKLAEKMNVSPSQVTEIVYGDTNCTLLTVAKAMHALNLRPCLLAVKDSDHAHEDVTKWTEMVSVESTNGKATEGWSITKVLGTDLKVGEVILVREADTDRFGSHNKSTTLVRLDPDRGAKEWTGGSTEFLGGVSRTQSRKRSGTGRYVHRAHAKTP